MKAMSRSRSASLQLGSPYNTYRAILYEKFFNQKNFWQWSLLHEYFNITNKDDDVS